MNKEELERKIDECESVKAIVMKASETPPPHYPVEPVVREQYDADVKRNSNRGVRKTAFEIGLSLGVSCGLYSTQNEMLPEAHKKTFPTLTLAHLEKKAQEIKQSIEQRKLSVSLLQKQKDNDTKSQWKLTGSILTQTQSGVSYMHQPDWDNYQRKIEAKIAVVELANLLDEEILLVYEEEIDNRKKSPKIKEINKGMAPLIKQAEKLIPKIVNAHMAAQKSLANGRKPDLKTSNNYLTAITEFNKLSDEFYQLKRQLDFYTTNADTPAFPVITGFDIEVDHQIKKVWRNST